MCELWMGRMIHAEMSGEKTAVKSRAVQLTTWHFLLVVVGVINAFCANSFVTALIGPIKSNCIATLLDCVVWHRSRQWTMKWLNNLCDSFFLWFTAVSKVHQFFYQLYLESGSYHNCNEIIAHNAICCTLFLRQTVIAFVWASFEDYY